MAENLLPRQDSSEDIGSSTRVLSGAWTERITFSGGGGYLTTKPAGTSGEITEYASIEIADSISLIGSPTTIAHGMSNEPRWSISWIECITAQNGWVIGDKVFVNPQQNQKFGWVIWWDTTNIYSRVVSSGPPTLNFTTGAIFTVTSSYWKPYVNLFY